MKRMIALFLAIIVCLSFAACGKDKAQNTENTKPQTATDQPSPGVNATIGAPQDPNESLQKISVEITLENWADYFELVEEIVYSTDDFGDFNCVANYWRLALKKGYEAQFSPQVQFEVQYTYQCVNVAIDHGQKTVSKLDLCPDVMEKTLKITTSGNDALITQTFIMPYDLQNPDKLYVYQLSDFQVLRIAGETSIDLLIIPE